MHACLELQIYLCTPLDKFESLDAMTSSVDEIYQLKVVCNGTKCLTQCFNKRTL